MTDRQSSTCAGRRSSTPSRREVLSVYRQLISTEGRIRPWMETAFREANIVQTPSLPGGGVRHAVWSYFRFSLSLREVEEMLAQRGIEVSRETIRC